jgi:transposase
LDVSVKTTSVCIVDEAGKIVKERSVATEPDLIAAWLGKTGLTIERVGHEAGPMSSWLHEGLSELGLPVVCVEARHMQTVLAAMRNKTDRNDARGIAQMMRTGWFRQVHIKSTAGQELRLLLVARRALIDRINPRSSRGIGRTGYEHIRVARKSSSHAAIFRRIRIESPPAALR